MPGIGKIKHAVLPQVMNEVSKKVAEKTGKKTEEENKAGKSDDVQISKKATTLNNTDTKIEDTSKQVTASEKVDESDKTEKGGKHSENTMKAKIEKLSLFVKKLRTTGISSKEISKILKDANRKNNEIIGKDFKQAYKEYKDKKISADNFKNKLYRSAIKKVDGIASDLQKEHSKVTFSPNQKKDGVAMTPRKSIFDKKNEPTLAVKAATNKKEKGEEAKPTINAEPKIKENVTPPGLAKKEEIPSGQVANTEKTENNTLKLVKKEDGSGNADKVLDGIVEMFHEMDKMINGLDKNLDEDGENKAFGNFALGLKNLFSDIDSAESNSFMKNLNKVAVENGDSDAHNVGVEPIKADSLSSLTKGGNEKSGMGINRVGDNGEGRGNFSAINFMSDMSINVSDGLDSYTDANGAVAENVARQTGAEAQLREVV